MNAPALKGPSSADSGCVTPASIARCERMRRWLHTDLWLESDIAIAVHLCVKHSSQLLTCAVMPHSRHVSWQSTRTDVCTSIKSIHWQFRWATYDNYRPPTSKTHRSTDASNVPGQLAPHSNAWCRRHSQQSAFCAPPNANWPSLRWPSRATGANTPVHTHISQPRSNARNGRKWRA